MVRKGTGAERPEAGLRACRGQGLRGSSWGWRGASIWKIPFSARQVLGLRYTRRSPRYSNPISKRKLRPDHGQLGENGGFRRRTEVVHETKGHGRGNS